jgi:hypothetical protein
MIRAIAALRTFMLTHFAKCSFRVHVPPGPYCTEAFASMSRAFFLLCAVAAAALPGLAALGGSAESVVADQVRFQAKRKMVAMPDYTIHEISREDGGVIREYVTPAGKVFGVSWNGPTIPDLTQLLGSYRAEFRDTLLAQPKSFGRRPAAVHNSELVVETGGHMHAFQGRAYLNSMLPAGVSPETIK